MKDQRAGHRYAQALFETAVAHNVVDSVEADLVAIDHLIKTDDDFRSFLYSPSRSREEKANILEKTLGDRVTALTLRLVRVMLEKRRETELGSVQESFTQLRRNHSGIVYAKVTSAFELNEAQQKAVVEKLSQTLGKKVESDFSLDTSLVGGVKVAYEDFILDGSVAGAFQRLRETFRNDAQKQS